MLVEIKSMGYVLAVDGGNSKTLAIVATLDGAILSIERGGCGDIYNATPSATAPDSTAAALENVERVIQAALRTAEISPADLDSSVFNMAGADWPEDIAFWRETMTAHGFGRHVTAQNDALGVLNLGAPDAVGVSIVCGTGAATGARAPDGRTWHSSFWQDEWHGSTHLGQKTLFAVYRAEMGLEPPTTLTQRVLAHFGETSVADVLHRFHNRQRPEPEHVGRLTPLLLDEAAANDEVALRLVREHGAGLGKMALVAMRAVSLHATPHPLVLAGGVFRHPTSVLEDAIVGAIRTYAPNVSPVRSPAEPVVGVVLQALSEAGVTLDESLRERMMTEIPPALLAHPH